ncbi:MAG: hypothetical protein K6G58_01275 [Lachnospiraceae bacterium]|nr:hypothetical protein [Lachnospiraceae bacterium]
MRFHGSVTVFLTLILTVIASFILTLAGSAQKHAASAADECAADNAARSCFGEYNAEVFRRYHILLIDSSYKGGEGGAERVEEHFVQYMENCMTDGTCTAEVTGYMDAGSDDNEYLYRSAAGYAGENTGIDARLSGSGEDALFLSYILDVCGNDAVPLQGAFRRGEAEYLIYGTDDGESIARARQEMEERGMTDYESFLCAKLEETDINLIRNRFGELLTEYMRHNGSPGFDLGKCFWHITVSARTWGRDRDGRVITREYGYDGL